ncbi:hypothetical protein JTB14_013869 [Gonioctena quinquepunctata]|nr:hypothetical protein JTB14_013869 [Gonioctena quinquepunctata]
MSSFVLFVQFSHVPSVGASGCEIDPFLVGTPLLIENGKSAIIYPKYGEGTVKFKAGEVVELSCSQRFIIIDGNQKENIVQASCVSDQKFSIHGETYSWQQISCNYNPLPIGRFTSGSCSNSGKLAEIGFVLDNQRFLRTMQICFDTESQNPLYSHFELSSTIAINAVGVPRPRFHLDEGFYHLFDGSVKHLYLKDNQRKTINTLLGLDENSEKYIENEGDLFLSRGHLSAHSDFVYAAQKNSTFRYINAAPQWQIINGRNWDQAEIDTRNYATIHNVSLKVWTGTYGVATLPHETTGKEIELYLYVHFNDRAIPVPAMYWKLIYNPSNEKAIVLIGLNNPYVKDVSKNVICNDISGQVDWLKWEKSSIIHGYSYACTVAEFRKVVTYAPNLSVSGLLV